MRSMNTTKLIPLLMFLATFAMACAGPDTRDDPFQWTPTMSPADAFNAAEPWLPESTAGLIIASGPEGWRGLETLIFPLADGALEPGSPGTGLGLKQDLRDLIQTRLGFDLLDLHTLVVGGGTRGFRVVAFGDVEMNGTPAMETEHGPIWEISLRHLMGQSRDEGPTGLARLFDPRLYLLAIDGPHPGLVFALSRDNLRPSGVAPDRADRLHRLLATVDDASPSLLFTGIMNELPTIGGWPIPVPETLLASFGERSTVILEGPESTLDLIANLISSRLNDARAQAQERYLARHSLPPLDALTVTYQYHLMEGLSAQGIPYRTDRSLRYDIEMLDTGWMSAVAIARFFLPEPQLPSGLSLPF